MAPQAAPGAPLRSLTNPLPAPAFQLPDLAGVVHRSPDYEGRVLIINFWASWCEPCRVELPSMNRAWTLLKPRGVAMLAINVDGDREAVRTFLEDFPIDFPVLLDAGGDTSRRWRVKGFPTTFVIDRSGHIVHLVVGKRQWDDPALIRQLLDLTATDGGGPQRTLTPSGAE